MLNVTVVGSGDGQLEILLRQLGMRVASTGPDKLDELAQATASPEVLVVDARRSRIPPELPAVKRRYPAMTILVVTRTLDSKVLLEAMRAGANEVVAEPLTAEDLEKAIMRAAGQRPVPEPGRAIGFIGAKGGVGTTTIAVNVAAALAAHGTPERTLLLDLHQAGGDVPLFFGIEPRFSIADALENIQRIDETFFHGLVTSVGDSLDVLAAADRIVSEPVDAAKLRRLIEYVVGSYRFIVLDLPRSTGQVLDALDQLSTIVVVANHELPTIRSANRLVARLRQRYGRDKVRLVMSRSDRHAQITDQDVERAVGAPVSHTVPSEYRIATHALHAGRPVVYDNHNNLAHSLIELALDLACLREDDQRTHHGGGLFSRLTHTVIGT